MTLIAGALFGLLWGTVIVSFASSIGATLAFLASRFLLRDWVQAKFGDKLKTINAGVEKEGAVLPLRAAPRARVSVLRDQPRDGADADAHVDVLLGEPARHARRHDRLRLRRHAARRIPDHVAARRSRWSLLGIFPLVAKKTLGRVQGAQGLRRWTRPQRFDRNVVVIGAGSAGLVSAYIAAAVKAKVTLDRKAPDGRRLPQHRLRAVESADPRPRSSLAQMRRAAELGLALGQRRVRFRRRDGARAARHQDDRAARLGRALRSASASSALPAPRRSRRRGASKSRSPAAERRTLTTRNIVIAAGARPFVPPIPGLREANPLTSDTVWNLRDAAAAPRRARRRPDRQRARAMFRALRLAGDAGRDAAAHPDARRPGDLRARRAARFARKASTCSSATRR